VRWAIAAVPDALSLLVSWPLKRKEDEALAELSALEPELNRLRQQHGRDRQAFNEAAMALYEERMVDPTKACLPTLLRVAPALLRCLLNAPALRGPFRQGVHDRVAETLVIEAVR
jgi:YidC/Oxa1 family membrane protein insertase